MERYKLTSEVARQENVSYYAIFNLVRHGRIPRPAKSASGQYLWGAEDIQAATQALARLRQRRQKKVERVA